MSESYQSMSLRSEPESSVLRAPAEVLVLTFFNIAWMCQPNKVFLHKFVLVRVFFNHTNKMGLRQSWKENLNPGLKASEAKPLLPECTVWRRKREYKEFDIMVLLSLGLPQHSALLLDCISSINTMQDSSSFRIRYKFSLIQKYGQSPNQLLSTGWSGCEQVWVNCGVVTQESVRTTREHRLEVHLRVEGGGRKYPCMVHKWVWLQTRQQRERPFLWLSIQIAFSH